MKEAQIERFKFYLLKFKEHMEMEGWTEKTVIGYMSDLKLFFEYLKTTDLEDIHGISKDTIYRYQMHLYSYKSSKGNPLSLSTQLGRLVSVRSFFRFLVKRGYFLYDPSASIDLPRKKKNLPRGIMTKKEMRKLLNQPDVDTPYGLRDKAILELLYSTGMRNSELRNLTVYDIDTVNMEVRINQGKGRKDRVVPLGEIAAKYLDEYEKTAWPYFLKRRSTFVLSRAKENSEKLEQGNGLLFLGGRGKKLTVGGLDLIINAYVKKAKLEKHITPHAIRHTCATHLLQGHASLRHIQELLGHRSVVTTQIYTHVELSDLKKEHRKCHPREQTR